LQLPEGTNLPRSYKEEFGKFFEDPNRVNLRDLLQNDYGEFSYLDYKEIWPSYPKLARHLLGLGNSNGGCIIIGVAENVDGTLDPKGIEKFEDKSNIQAGIKKYIPPQVLGEIDGLNFSFDEVEYYKIRGKKFQAVLIKIEPENLPLIARSEYLKEIRNNAIYVRRGTSSEEAIYEELQGLSTGHSTQSNLNMWTHLQQLKALLDQRAQLRFGIGSGGMASMSGSVGMLSSMGGNVISDMEFETFINEMVEKKKRIEMLISTT